MMEKVRLGDMHSLTWNAECIRAHEGHDHRCRCGEHHEPTADEAAMIHRAAQEPGDPCCVSDEGDLISERVQAAFDMTVEEFKAAVARQFDEWGRE